MNKHKRSHLLYGIAGVVVAAGIAYACKDFLNVPPQGTLDQNVLATKAGVEGTLIAAYRSLDCSSSSAGSWGCAVSNWVWGSVTSDDAYRGSEVGDQQPIHEIETYLWSLGDVDVYLNQKWSQVYEGVSRANATLRLLATVQASKPGAISTVDANGIKGEALFLRAHYHFEAWRMWGNVPYYFENDVDFRKPNNLGVDSVARLIMTDLKTAMSLLPTKPRNGNIGRATFWTAKAYLGRVQAYEAGRVPAYWDSTRITLDSVRTFGPYNLEQSFDRVWTGFAQYQNGPETILAYQASVKDGEPNGWNSNWGERLNFPHSGSHFGCCGFHQPAQNLVNAFVVDANGLPAPITDPNWDASPGPAYRDTNFVGGILTPAVDPRLDWTVGRDVVPYKDWGLHQDGWIRSPAYSGHYSPKKNVQEQAANAENNVGWVTTQTNDVNIHVFRYADMLLLLAEAYVETGPLDNARIIVNQIRTRAAQAAQWCGIADSAVDSTYSACKGDTRMFRPLAAQTATVDTLTAPWSVYRIGTYPGPWTVQDSARKYVRTERRLELAMEGQRFFDLRRWGIADTTLNNYVAIEKLRRGYLTEAVPVVYPKYAYYPLPTIQIELSRVGGVSRLTQNPGW